MDSTNRDAGGDSCVAQLTCLQSLPLPSQTIGESAGLDNNDMTFVVEQAAWQCTFSPDGQLLAVCFGAPNPCIRIWQQLQQQDQQETSSAWVLVWTVVGIHERTIRSISFAPLPSSAGPSYYVLASASFDGTACLWEYNGGNNKIRKDWECIAQLEGHDHEVKCIVWNSTGSLLATSGRDKTVWIWECFLPGTIGGVDSSGTGDVVECLAVLQGHQGDVKCVAFANSHGQWGDGDDIVVSAGFDASIRIWAEDAGGDWYCAMVIATSPSQSQTSFDATIWSIAVTPSSTRFVAAGSHGTLTLYKSFSAQEKSLLCSAAEAAMTPKTHGLWKRVGPLAALPTSESDAFTNITLFSVVVASTKTGHGRIATAGSDGCVRVYRDVVSMVDHASSSHAAAEPPPPPPCAPFVLEAIGQVEARHGDLHSVAWHPLDGSILATASESGTVQIWRYQRSSKNRGGNGGQR